MPPPIPLPRNDSPDRAVSRSMTSPAERAALPASGWRIELRKALLLSAVCWAGFILIAWLAANGHTEAIDRTGLLFWRQAETLEPVGPPWVQEAVRDVTALGGVFLRKLFAIGAAVALLFIRLRREAMLLVLTVIGGWLAGYALKLLLGRERPDIVPHLMAADGASFPSGHSFNAAVVYIAIALAFAAMSRRPTIRHVIIGTAIALSIAIAWSRVWLGVHFPTDVVAGWLGGAGWTFLAASLRQRPAQEMVTMARRNGP